MEKYGCENPMQNAGVKEKKIQTSIENFGCEHPMQNADISEKSLQNSYKSKD